MITLFLGSFLLYLAYKDDMKKRAICIYLLSCIIIFISAFSSEALLITFIWLYILISVYVSFYGNKNKRYMVYSVLVILLLVLVLQFLSPGTNIRANAETSEKTWRLFWSLWRSLMTTFERSFENYFISMLIPASIFIYFLISIKKLPILIPSLSLKKHALLFFLVGFTCGWAAHFTITFSLGFYGLPPRAKMIPQTFNLIFFLLANIYFFTAIDLEARIKKPAKAFIICCMWLFLTAFCSKELIGSILSYGEHQEFYKTYTARMNYLKSGNGFIGQDVVIVPKLPYTPKPISNRHLSADCSYYVNSQFAHYYGIKGCVRIEDGADGDASNATRIIKNVEYFFSDGLRNFIHKKLFMQNK